MTQKAAESESDEEMEAPTQEPGLEDNEEESDSYGNLVTSEDNPWKLDTSGAGFHSLETSNNVDNGNFYLKKQTNKQKKREPLIDEVVCVPVCSNSSEC